MKKALTISSLLALALAITPAAAFAAEEDAAPSEPVAAYAEIPADADETGAAEEVEETATIESTDAVEEQAEETAESTDSDVTEEAEGSDAEDADLSSDAEDADSVSDAEEAVVTGDTDPVVLVKEYQEAEAEEPAAESKTSLQESLPKAKTPSETEEKTEEEKTPVNRNMWVRDYNKKTAYYLGNDGKPVVPKYPDVTIKVDGVLYLADSGGMIKLEECEITVNKKTYHTNNKGQILTGFHTFNDAKYLANSNGVIQTGKEQFVKSGGAIYFLTKEGSVAVDEIIEYKKNTYFADENGKLRIGIFELDDIYYYTDSSGALSKKAGTVTFKGNRYYVRKDGTVALNQTFITGGKMYKANKKGLLVKGVFKSGGKYYYSDSNGAVSTKAGFVTWKGKKYYNRKGGGLKQNTFVKVKGKYYYLGKDASVQTKAFTFHNYKVKPNKKGVISAKTYKKVFPNGYNYTRYALIDLSSQKLTYYVDGEVAYSCKVTTGRKGSKTPIGAYKVRGRATNVDLISKDQTSHATYWINIKGNTLGLRDMSGWTRFGNKKYLTRGSTDGTVYLPTAAAKQLYRLLTVGTPVIIQK